jgi:hypothetical protein
MASFTPWITSVIDADVITRAGQRSSLVQLLDCAKLLEVITNRNAGTAADGKVDTVTESEMVGES